MKRLLFFAILLPTLSRPSLTTISWASFTVGGVHVKLTVLDEGFAPTPDARPNIGAHEVSGDIIHRVFFDSAHRPTFGYDLRLTPNPQARTIRVEVRRPARLTSFTKLPAPVTVADGDRIELPVIQNPRTGARLVDSLALAFPGTGISGLPILGDLPEYAPKDTVITIQQPRLHHDATVDGENAQLGATAPIVWVYSRWYGRFLFSATPRTGFRRNAIAARSQIGFSDGVEKYLLTLHAPAVTQPGTWWLWVKREPNFQPPPGPWTEKELHDGLLAIGVER
jgi:hypothetical protein